ncbi:Bro-N domain-containing protein [Shimia sp. R11_0]|nr:Bro-N domain-containing protein [Shimia sp. R11_0]
MEINSEDTTLTSDDTTQTQPVNCPSQTNDEFFGLEGANAAPASSGTHEVGGKPRIVTCLAGPNADTSTQDAAEVQELTASNDNNTPAAESVIPIIGRIRTKVYWERRTSNTNGLDTLGVRTVTIDGEPWFVAKDVCEVLTIKNSRDKIAGLDDDEKDCVHISDAMGRLRETGVINESGLYSLIMTSRKQEAKRFKKWVTSEVLPTIRKTGIYGQPAQQKKNPARPQRSDRVPNAHTISSIVMHQPQNTNHKDPSPTGWPRPAGPSLGIPSTAHETPKFWPRNGLKQPSHTMRRWAPKALSAAP